MFKNMQPCCKLFLKKKDKTKTKNVLTFGEKKVVTKKHTCFFYVFKTIVLTTVTKNHFKKSFKTLKCVFKKVQSYCKLSPKNKKNLKIIFSLNCN